MNPKTPVAAPPAPLTNTLHDLSLPKVVDDFLATKSSLHTRQAYETILRGFFEANGFHVLDDLHPAHTPMAEVSRLIRDYLSVAGLSVRPGAAPLGGGPATLG